MKILVTGGKGMLGRTLCKNWPEHEMICADLPEVDITDREKFTALVAAVRPDTVIHCAAMTAVDRCETEKDLAYLLNAQGSANVAHACAENDVRLIAISTDYVFNGELGLFPIIRCPHYLKATCPLQSCRQTGTKFFRAVGNKYRCCVFHTFLSSPCKNTPLVRRKQPHATNK